MQVGIIAKGELLNTCKVPKVELWTFYLFSIFEMVKVGHEKVIILRILKKNVISRCLVILLLLIHYKSWPTFAWRLRDCDLTTWHQQWSSATGKSWTFHDVNTDLAESLLLCKKDAHARMDGFHMCALMCLMCLSGASVIQMKTWSILHVYVLLKQKHVVCGNASLNQCLKNIPITRAQAQICIKSPIQYTQLSFSSWIIVSKFFKLLFLSSRFRSEVCKTLWDCWGVPDHIWAAAECRPLIGWREASLQLTGLLLLQQ